MSALPTSSRAAGVYPCFPGSAPDGNRTDLTGCHRRADADVSCPGTTRGDVMKVAVVGAGYAGTCTANRLARRHRTAEITVLNPRPFFVERVRLHQRIAGTAEASAP